MKGRTMINADPTEVQGPIDLYHISRLSSHEPLYLNKNDCYRYIAQKEEIHKMKYFAATLILFSGALAMSPQASESPPPFTINLLTKVRDMSIISPGGTIPISCTNATEHQIYETNVTWSVIGSATFQEERVPQWYLNGTSSITTNGAPT